MTFISLDEYDLRLARQVNGDHKEDVLDAMCLVVDDTEECIPDNFHLWYGARYATYSNADIKAYECRPERGNEAATLIAICVPSSPDITLIVDFGN